MKKINIYLLLLLAKSVTTYGSPIARNVVYFIRKSAHIDAIHALITAIRECNGRDIIQYANPVTVCAPITLFSRNADNTCRAEEGDAIVYAKRCHQENRQQLQEILDVLHRKKNNKTY